MKNTYTNNELLRDLNVRLRHHPKDVNVFCVRNYVDQQPLFKIVNIEKIIKSCGM